MGVLRDEPALNAAKRQAARTITARITGILDFIMGSNTEDVRRIHQGQAHGALTPFTPPLCAVAFPGGLIQPERMTQPLALVLYEKLLPGSQVVNRLQDLNYRVDTVSDPAMLVECAEQGKPMLVLVDLDSSRNDVCSAIARLKENPGTNHLPVIAFGAEQAAAAQSAAKAAGATLVVTEAVVLNHLRQVLDQALQVE